VNGTDVASNNLKKLEQYGIISFSVASRFWCLQIIMEGLKGKAIPVAGHEGP
jgi:hypothetical protein